MRARKSFRPHPVRLPRLAPLTAFAALAVFSPPRALAQAPSVNAPSSAPSVPPVNQAAKAIQAAFEAVVRTAGPATVRILSVAPPVSASQVEEDNAFGGVDGFDFRRPRRGGSGSAHGVRERPLGSGVLIRPDGYILTADHVVEDSPGGKVLVTLSDGSTYTGTVLRDTPSDLAVVKINAPRPLPFAPMADSADVQVGQWAIVIGSPFNEVNTVTAGIVSALHRNREIADAPPVGDRFYTDMIQTDAPINPGNSGGPLLDIDGALIGINVAILTHSGFSAGVGFAIPINAARRVADELIAKGTVRHAALGVLPTDIPYYLRERLGTRQGAYITRVPDDTPAAKAGIQPGDVIVRFGAIDIDNATAYLTAIGRAEPSSTVAITLLRDGKSQTVTATLADAAAKSKIAPDAPAASAVLSSASAANRQPALEMGIRAIPLAATRLEQLRLKPGTVGVYVSRVLDGSPASDAGLERGCVIVGVGGKPVATVEALNAALMSARSGDVVTLSVVLAPTEDAAASRGVVDVLVP